jgi:VanZ family protein
LRSQVRAWWPVVAYAGLILAGSSIPASSMPESQLLRHDKLIHAAEYAVFGALLVRGFSLGRPALRGFDALAAAVVLAAAFGTLDEWYQSITPGRHPSVWDVAADTAGGLCGGALALLRYRGAHRHHREEANGYGPQVRNENAADR